MQQDGVMAKYTIAKLIDCLANEYAYLCFEDETGTPEELKEYIEELHNKSYEELIEETWTDTDEQLKEYIENYENSTYR